MKTPNVPTTVKTVAELRAWLQEMEDSWTDQDTEYLGHFDLQEIQVPYFKVVDRMPIKFMGIGPASIHFTELGFIIEQPITE